MQLSGVNNKERLFHPAGQWCVRDAHVPRSIMLQDLCASYQGRVHLAIRPQLFKSWIALSIG